MSIHGMSGMTYRQLRRELQNMQEIQLDDPVIIEQDHENLTYACSFQKIDDNLSQENDIDQNQHVIVVRNN